LQDLNEEGLQMNHTAMTMAERIRAAMAAQAQTATITDGVAASQAFREAVGAELSTRYDVSLEDVARLFVPNNDFIWGAAEQGVGVAPFAKAIGSQFCLAEIDRSPADRAAADHAAYVAGENNMKLALAEYAMSNADWTYSDGYAVTDHQGDTLVVGASYAESVQGWKFSAFVAPMDRDAFVALSPAKKAALPTESLVFGDINECVDRIASYEIAPAAMRM
jgi:hypothetical protein